uniref:hypothetical protein n=1 Tax=Leifsonia aquatica TaxID=144185 RepID=UPI0004686261
MTSSNRALNRILLGTVGVIALVVAAAATALLVVPGFARARTRVAHSGLGTADDVFGQPLWDGTTVSAGALVSLAIALAFVVLLLVFILRQGHGATSTVIALEGEDGTIEMDASVPAALLEGFLAPVTGVAGVSVTAYRVRRQPMLKVTVRCRRGAAARTIADALDDAVVRTQEALGAPIPVF